MRKEFRGGIRYVSLVLSFTGSCSSSSFTDSCCRSVTLLRFPLLPWHCFVAEVLLLFVFRCFLDIVCCRSVSAVRFPLITAVTLFFSEVLLFFFSSSVKRPQSILLLGSGINTDQNKNKKLKRNSSITLPMLELPAGHQRLLFISHARGKPDLAQHKAESDPAFFSCPPLPPTPRNRRYVANHLQNDIS